MKIIFFSKIFLLSVFTLIFLQSTSALTAESSNYSVARFGTGLQASNIVSNALTGKAVILADGGTRNAENEDLLANVGFWGNVSHYPSVSITSYSISPKSAAIGSTIGLSVSALNAQSVWAKITSPDNQEQIINLVNGQTVNYLPSPSVLGRYEVMFYAASSTGAIANYAGYFDLTVQETPPPTQIPTAGASGSGDGASSSIAKEITLGQLTEISALTRQYIKVNDTILRVFLDSIKNSKLEISIEATKVTLEKSQTVDIIIENRDLEITLASIDNDKAGIIIKEKETLEQVPPKRSEEPNITVILNETQTEPKVQNKTETKDIPEVSKITGNLIIQGFKSPQLIIPTTIIITIFLTLISLLYFKHKKIEKAPPRTITMPNRVLAMASSVNDNKKITPKLKHCCGKRRENADTRHSNQFKDRIKRAKRKGLINKDIT